MMMANPNVTTTTKSIDVGSMFLMDISVHESEPNGDLLSNDSTITLDDSDSSIFTSSDLKLRHTNQQHQTYKLNEHGDQKPAYVTPADGEAPRQSIGYRSSNQQQLGTDYLSNSLDRLASAIQADEGHNNKNKSSGGIIKMKRNNGKNTNTVTIVEPQPPPEIAENQSSSSSSSSNASSPLSSASSSLSDESFVASSVDSLTASYTGGSGAEEEDKHDIQDLVEANVDDKFEQNSEVGTRQHNNIRSVQQERPISKKNVATNLINSANRSISSNNHNKSSTNNDNYDATNKPTNYSNHHHHHHHHHHHDHSHRSQSKRSVSASLPIQVPARQMKKDLNKLKLGLKNNNYNFETITTTKITTRTITTSSTQTDPIDAGDSNSSSYNNANQHDNQSAMSVAFDDVDEFLEQEYNDNHHNHYPIDEYDEENLRAEENPMKLFESIQALARSLHEDTELFGSLPPKRMLESPIRSLALV